MAPEPSPEEATALEETMKALAAQLDERERVVLEMSLQGHSVEEISEKIGRTTRTVYRTLDKIRELLEEMRRRTGRTIDTRGS